MTPERHLLLLESVNNGEAIFVPGGITNLTYSFTRSTKPWIIFLFLSPFASDLDVT